MRKGLLMSCMLGVILTILTVNAFASNFSSSWTPIQFSVWDGTANWPDSNNVYGLILGIPYAHYDAGLDTTSAGLILSLVTECDNAAGAQISILNIETENCAGVQLAGMNVARHFDGLQIGGYNELQQSGGFQVGLANVSSVQTDSAMVGIINHSDKETNGFQVGVINTSYDFAGLQIGVVNTNFEEKSSDIQIGLINYMENGFLPVFPLFNFSL